MQKALFLGCRLFLYKRASSSGPLLQDHEPYSLGAVIVTITFGELPQLVHMNHEAAVLSSRGPQPLQPSSRSLDRGQLR